MSTAIMDRDDVAIADERTDYTVMEACARLRLGKNSVYRLLETGALKRRDLHGIRKTLITRESVELFLAK